MHGPRIISGRSSVPFERLRGHWPLRYGVAIVAGIVLCVAELLLRRSLATEFHLLLLFSAILLGSVLGGLGPGLLATAAAVMVGYNTIPLKLVAPELRLLAIQGVLISVVGGTLRSARVKARERLAANLKLEQQILEIGDDERRRIGHDLHDGLGQQLTGISLLSETMAQQLAAGAKPDPANVEIITRLASEAVRITRDLAKSLSPVTLERDGLIAAIEELADTSSALFGIKCSLECEDQQLPVDRTRALPLFRIVQEAVNNSVRHGKAKNVRIGVMNNPRELIVSVVDDGSGLSQKTTANPGLGLRIMEYRARMLDASLTVERASTTGGTVVTCTCPLDGAAAEK